MTKNKLQDKLSLLINGAILMSNESFELAYDGPALRNHKMDVKELAPALLGIGNLIREANFEINGEAADVRVLIKSEFKAGSFEIGFDIWQNIVHSVGPLLGDEGVKTAKDILEWLDLLKGPILGAASAAGVFGYYKWRKGRDVKDIQQISDTSESGDINIFISGDNNPFTIDRRVFDLSQKPKIAKAAKALIAPLDGHGIDTLKTISDNKEHLLLHHDEVESIAASCDAVLQDENTLSCNVVEAHLSPIDAKFNPDATSWKFDYGGQTILVDISETSIASDAMSRRVISMDDLYHVNLEISERLLQSGKTKNDYKILKLIERKRGHKQVEMFEGPENADEL